MIFEVLTTVTMKITVLLVVTTCSLVGVPTFLGTCCLHLQGTNLKVETAGSSETFVTIFQLYGVSSQKTAIFIQHCISVGKLKQCAWTTCSTDCNITKEVTAK